MDGDNSRDSKNRSREETVELVIFIVAAIALAYGINAGIHAYSGLDTSLVVVETGSMQPTLTGIYVFDPETRTTYQSPVSGDVLLIKKIAPSELQLGDIIVFEDPRGGEIPIVHRIVEKYEKTGIYYFRTSGDNPLTNNQVDWWEIPQDQVIGKVVSRIPRIGYLKLSLQTSMGRLILVLAIILLIGSMFLFPDESKKSQATEKESEVPSARLRVKSQGDVKRVSIKNMCFAVLILFVVATPALINSVEVIAHQTSGEILSVNLNQDPRNTPQLSVKISLWSGGYFWKVLDSAAIHIDGYPEPEFVWTSPYRWMGTKEISADFFIEPEMLQKTSLMISLVVYIHNGWGGQWTEEDTTSITVY